MFRKNTGKDHSAGVSLLLAAIVFVAFLFSDPELSNAGDKNISTYLLSGTSRPGFYFISPFLAMPLRGLYSFLPIANWWFVFSAAVLFVGLWIFLYLIFGMYGKNVQAFALAVAFCNVFWEAVCKEPVNFTQTAGIACLAGMLLLIRGGLQNKKYAGFHRLAGIFLMILSGFTRFKVMVMCMPFGIMAVCYGIFLEVRKGIRHSNKWKLLSLLCLTVVFCYGADTVYGLLDPSRKEYVDANAAREAIYDYKGMYPSFEEAAGQYTAIGVEESLLNMIYNNYTSDKNYFSSESLEKIGMLKGKSNLKASDMADKLAGHGMLWLWILVMTVYVIYLKGIRSAVLPFLGNIAGFLAGCMCFIYIGRIEWRVVVCVVLAAALFFLLMSAEGEAETIKDCLFQKIVVIAFSIYTICVNYLTIGGGYFPLPMVRDETKALLLNYMNQQKDIVYFTSSTRFCDAYNVFAAAPRNFCDNVFNLKAHFLLGAEEKLAEYGIVDPIPDMLRLEYIQTTWQRVWWEYLCHYYSPAITASVVDEYQGTSFIRYVSPISMDRVETYPAGDFTDLELNISYDEKLGGKRISIQGELSTLSGDTDIFSCCYLNIVEKDTQITYTYALALKGGKYYGTAFWMDDTWSSEGVSAYLIGSVNGERYVCLANLTEEFRDAAEVYSAGKE